jgi:hypothetical protein
LVFLCSFLRFRPSGLRSFPGTSAALFIGHGFEAALTADPAPLGPHVPHDLLNYGQLDGFRRFYGFHKHAPCVLDGIKFFAVASPLWHISSVARIAAARQAAANFK